ncbi:hypothetical protein PHET_08786 [Paragonimus heterotremus]|uniref:UBC core domain-containing protein n=1 Tax=Paragonimus heterotremus TaxID=100268 RepID=A0A8J4TBA7_9TREM|nr:hypothetical protein PHET_08786 [Paragonimus heterotremus]
MTQRSFLREFMSLSSSALDEFQDQVKLLPIDDSNLRLFKVEISPKTGIYAHATFLFMINVPDTYPNNPPVVSCLTPVFHPNIDPLRCFDNVCFNLTERWNRSFGLKSLLHALLFLFYEPNFEDPVNGFASNLPEGASFEHYVRQSLMGGTINSVTYEANQIWCRWAEENGLLASLSEKGEQTEYSDSITPAPMERQVSSTSAYFQRIVSTQFDPSPPPTPSSPQTEDNSFLLNDFSPFACLRRITVEQTNLTSNSDQMPWMNFSRYYFGEETVFEYQFYLADCIDASFVYLAPPLAWEVLQRSDVLPWFISPDGPICLRTDALEEQPTVSGNDYVDRPQVGSESAVTDGNGQDERNNVSVTSHIFDPPICQSPRRSDFGVDQGSKANSMSDNPFDHPRSCSPNETDHAVVDDTMLPGVRNTHQDETAPPSTNGNESITSIRSGTTGLETEMNHITVDLQSNPDSLFCSKADGDFGTETSGADPQVSLDSHGASQFSPGDHLADFTEMANDYLNQHDYEGNSESQYDIGSRPEVDELVSRMYKFTYRFFVHLQPPSWFLYQTRWPPFLAPGRLAVLTREDRSFQFHRICRASSIQLRLELNQYAAKSNSSPLSFVLADPLALSPFSPILNRVITVRNPTASELQLTILVTYLSVEWLSVTEALFGRVPPVTELGTRRAPGSALLACLCWLSNWVAYFSRLELYGLSLGYSRPRLTWLIKSVGDVCISPATLGCGQTPLLDAWPLFLLRQTFRWSSSLLVYLATSLSSGDPTFQSCRLRFPFSDLDEI